MARKQKEDEIVKIPLANTDDLYAIVYAADWFLLALWKYKWRVKWTSQVGSIYVATDLPSVKGKRHCLYLHRFIMGEPRDMEIDHLDNNSLNNRNTNLEIIPQDENKRRMWILRKLKIQQEKGIDCEVPF